MGIPSRRPTNPRRPRLFVACGTVIGFALLGMACRSAKRSAETVSEPARPATTDERRSMMRAPIDEAVARAEALGYVCSAGGMAFRSSTRQETTFECRSCRLTIEERGMGWTLSLAAKDGILEQLGASEYDLAIAGLTDSGLATCSELLQEMQAAPVVSR